MARALEAIVENGLCIGCGLCQSVAGRDRVRVVMTDDGRERPIALAPLDRKTLDRIFEICPGVRIEGLTTPVGANFHDDPMWGRYAFLKRGYAGDPEIRFKGATGGVLTALAIHLLETKQVDFILHVTPSETHPMRTRAHISRTRADVMRGIASRYGPAAPLVDLLACLDEGRPFAVVAKPCDLAGVRNLARLDPRVDSLIRFRLTMVCGGASEFGFSTDIVRSCGLEERDVTLMRYRGYGCPGPTRIEARDGRAFERSYDEVWQSEDKWRIQSRCKLCPEALGEFADVVALDVWPNADPQGEDEGFNAIFARTERGLALLDDAIKTRALVVDRDYTPRELDWFQPHQTRKKRAMAARYLGLALAGQMVPRVRRVRLLRQAREGGPATFIRECLGALLRSRKGRTREPRAVPEAGALS